MVWKGLLGRERSSSTEKYLNSVNSKAHFNYREDGQATVVWKRTTVHLNQMEHIMTLGCTISTPEALAVAYSTTSS